MNTPEVKKFYYKRRDLREILGITNYRIRTMIADGILDAPVKEKGRAEFWTRKQVEAAIRRLEEKAAPKLVVIDRPRRSKPLSQNHRTQILRSIS